MNPNPKKKVVLIQSTSESEFKIISTMMIHNTVDRGIFTVKIFRRRSFLTKIISTKYFVHIS